jgi:hypothetical protein
VKPGKLRHHQRAGGFHGFSRPRDLRHRRAARGSLPQALEGPSPERAPEALLVEKKGCGGVGGAVLEVCSYHPRHNNTYGCTSGSHLVVGEAIAAEELALPHVADVEAGQRSLRLGVERDGEA